ncbi:DUF3489 domain-containing protein [Bosea sp. (in: a-proteobacteria)]|jgi:transglutaminase/protease-like cytokinesis protein 3|uniref:DUF3489 domain-containing protein n=1 Tax=Bosea sp. (in: a-proteobacteria) TaxID=1871050 RepID=UPI003F6EDCD0
MISKTKTAKNTSRKSPRAAKPTPDAAVTTAKASPTNDDETQAATASSPMIISQAPRSQTSRPKASSKLGIVLGLLEDPAGASLRKLVEVTGWLPHTTRAALTGLRKRGFPVVLDAESKGGSSVYRVHTDAA